MTHRERSSCTTAHQRSAAPRRGVVAALVCLSVVAFVGWLLFWRFQTKRFQVVRSNVLYRIGQPTEFGLRHLVRRYGIRTVLSLQLYECRLPDGWFDPGDPQGTLESEFVRSIGARSMHWPMGEEVCWPWLTPWQFEEFFKLFDNPENFPVVVHCMGGRHRTGTISALFRLEYDRWPVEQALREMYSFEFGSSAAVQEHNLRTYLPRPRPTTDEWKALHAAFAGVAPADAAGDYEALVRTLRAARHVPEVASLIAAYLSGPEPFGLALAQRLIDAPDDRWVEPMLERAIKCLTNPEAEPRDWSIAAAVVADFGTVEQQANLLEIINRESMSSHVTPRYAAVVAGVTNRYTPNRLAYLRPLLDDARPRPEAEASRYRYCDTALARLAAISNDRRLSPFSTVERRDQARSMARAWFEEHPEALRLTTLLPPSGNNPIRISDGAPPEYPENFQR